MTAKEFKARFITVHRCGGCGEILDWKSSDNAFCDKCTLDWNAALIVGCPECFKPARECACMTKLLSKSGALCHRKLFFYQREDAYSPHMSIIFCLKRKKSKRFTEFAASAMLEPVIEELDAFELFGEKHMIAVSSVPRSKRAKALSGFDHAEMLAAAISRKLGVEHIRAFNSSYSAKQQKTLDARGRLANAKRNISLSRKAEIKGRYVLLIDDMVTTGASMSVCVKSLMDAGALGVLCFSVASKSKI